MAYFEVLKTHTEKTVIRRKQRKDRDGNVSVVEFIESVAISPGAYGHENISVGQVLEINGPLAAKASNNREYFKQVEEPEKKTRKKRGKKE